MGGDPPHPKVYWYSRCIDGHESNRPRTTERHPGAVGRFERDVSAQFTKEELAAIANDLGTDPDGGSTVARASIRWRVGLSESAEAADGGPFAKAELQAIADAVGADTDKEE